METLLDVLDESAARFGDREVFALRRDDGSSDAWSYTDLARRARAAAWRLRAIGLRPGDHLLTWSPSTPELPATYFGAMLAGIVLVPLDLRMASDAIKRIAAKAGASHLAAGSGRDAPDPREAGLDTIPTTTVETLAAEPDESFPADWREQVDTWPRPRPEDLYEIVFTSGTTGTPKGVMLTHANVIATLETAHNAIPPFEHRLVSVLPLSHIMEQAIGLFYVMTVGADIMYVRSRTPKVIFEALRDHRVTTMLLVPQVLELFWSAIEREAEKAGKARQLTLLRAISRHLPYPLRRLIFRPIHQRFGGGLELMVSAAAFLPPVLQQAWEDIGVIVMQGYGATECGPASTTTKKDHGLGTVGRTIPPVEMRLAEDGEIQVRGPTVFAGYYKDEEATKAAFTEDGWYRTGDIGRHDEQGRLILMGRTKDIIVLPNGLNVYPEDVENALRIAGIHDSVVVETAPGRIETVVADPAFQTDPEATKTAVAARIKAANATLAVHQRIVGWRAWPEDDFPRTHTLKVRRDRIRAWIAADVPIPISGDDAPQPKRRGLRSRCRGRSRSS
jgi:long-chain acyl-CoA synthetase